MLNFLDNLGDMIALGINCLFRTKVANYSWE
jgi:hypothetical protein